MKKSYKEVLNLRFRGRMCNLRIGHLGSVADLREAIESVFELGSLTIEGFATSEGLFVSLEELYRHWRGNPNEVYTLIAKQSERRRRPSSKKKITRVQKHFVEEELGDESQVNTPSSKQGLNYHHYDGPTEIENLDDFLDKIGRDNGSTIFTIMFVQNQTELVQNIARYEEAVAQYSFLVDPYYYIVEGGEYPDEKVEVHSYPLLVMYRREKRIAAFSSEEKWNLFRRCLRKVQKLVARTVTEEDSVIEVGKSTSSYNYVENGDSDQARISHDSRQRLLNFIEELSRSEEINEKEFYFLKCSILEGQKELHVQLFSHLRSHDRKSAAQFVDRYLQAQNLRPNPRRLSSKSIEKKEGSPKHANGNPSYLRSRSKESTETNALQDNYIQCVDALAEQVQLSEEISNSIKSLILEENQEVYKVLKKMQMRDSPDPYSIKRELVGILQKLRSSSIRPNSPFLLNDQIEKTAEALIRRRVKDKAYIQTLRRLISDFDELVFSAFEVFKSDFDEDDLYDTLIRIIQLSWQKKKPSPQKNRIESQLSQTYNPRNKYENGLDSQERGRRFERTEGNLSSHLSRTKSPVPRDFSYFLKPESAREGTNTQNFIAQEESPKVRETDSAVQASNGNQTELKRATNCLQSNEKIKSLNPELYGILFHLLAKEKEIISDVVEDNGGWDQLDNAVPSLEVIAKKKWEAFLFNNFSAKERAFLSQKMRIPNSAVYEYLQRFRSDYNLNELQVSLNSYFGELNLPKDNDDSSRSRSNPRKISNETNQSSDPSIDLPPSKFSVGEDSGRNRKVVSFVSNGNPPGSSEAKANENTIMSNLKEVPLSATKKEESPAVNGNQSSKKEETLQNGDQTKKEDDQKAKIPLENKIPAQSQPQTQPQVFTFVVDTIGDQTSQEQVPKSEDHTAKPKMVDSPVSQPITSMNSEMGDFARAAKFMQVSMSELSEAAKTPTRDRLASEGGILRTPGSKFAALLKVDRQDSLKGFQIKLMSGDSQDTTPRTSIQPELHAVSAFGRQDSSQPQQLLDLRARSASCHVLIPEKEEKNEVEREFIDKFHQTVTEKNYHKVKFQQLMAKVTTLSELQLDRLKYLMEHNNEQLFELLIRFDKEGHTPKIEQALKEIAELDPENLSICSSPTEKKRLFTYNSFKTLLKNLMEYDKLISEKQYRTFVYLYMEEATSVLACHEVYLYNGDVKEFLDTLSIIEKVQFFKKDSEFIEKISDYDDQVQEQTRIIYSLNKYLNFETRNTLEQIIRTGDSTVLDYHKKYRLNQITKNELIHKLLNFAEEKETIINNFALRMMENQMNQDSKVNKRKETIETFERGKFIKGLPHMDKIYQMIEEDDAMICSIFEVYDKTKDKNEFIENIKILHSMKERQYIIELIKNANDTLKFSDIEISKCNALLKKKNSILAAMTQALNRTKDEQDFLDTLKLLRSSGYLAQV